ncbi:MAG TPA: amino acid ABC transporter substrate-binding protein [Azospirillum sp.]|nr:amino acid ABC transporter substrate-binding protein [Azospirillum sp.]
MRRRAALLLVAFLAAALGPSAVCAQELGGTLLKVRSSGRIVLGFREDAFPFAYLDARRQPTGYSLDLCRAIVDEVAAELGREVAVEHRPVTAETRIPALLDGSIDLECGATTNSHARQRQVAFSPLIFVSGTRLLVPQASRIASHQDLRGKAVVVTAGTTNEAAVRQLVERQRLDVKLLAGADHDKSFAMLESGEADAFAGDEVLLYGLLARTGRRGVFRIVGDYLSYDPYGIMFRKDDPAFAEVVERTFTRLAGSREIMEIYTRWFLRRLPTGERLDIAMSPQLEESFHILGLPE